MEQSKSELILNQISSGVQPPKKLKNYNEVDLKISRIIKTYAKENMVEYLKIKEFYKRRLEIRRLEIEPYIYVDGVKVYQELPEKWKMILNKIKVLKIQIAKESA